MAQIPNDTYAATFAANTNGKAVLIITADNTQDLEFFYPYYRLVEEGYDVTVATPKGGEFKGKMGMGLKNTEKLSAMDAHDYCLLYIPGGKAPEELKKNQDALKLVKAFVDSGKPIAAICHGPQVLAAANVIKGHKLAAWPEVQKEVEAAGATYMDTATVVDGQFITARWPGDLPSHMSYTLQVLRNQQLNSGSPVGVLRAAQG